MKQSLEKSKTISSPFYINSNPNRIFTLDIDFVTRKIVCSTRYIISNGKSKAQNYKINQYVFKRYLK